MVDVLVEYEYLGKEEDELTLKVGDIVTNVDKADGGWWEGEMNGKRGVFPDNFVKEIKKEDKKSKEPSAGVRKEPRGHVAELATKLGKGGGIKVGMPGGAVPVIKRNQDPEKKRIRAKVTFSYTSENDDELTLELGEVVEITKQEEEGWWEANCNGKIGMIPSNFVEIIDDGTTENFDSQDDDSKEILTKKVKGVGLGNIFSDGPIKLRSTRENDCKVDSKLDESREKRSSVRHAPPVPRPSAETKQVERAKVLYDYDAENEDELTIREGDIIVILDKHLEDSGWWKGELAGKSGVFPDNFVELLQLEEAKPKKPPPPSIPPVSANKVIKAERSTPGTQESNIEVEPSVRRREIEEKPSRPEKPSGPVPAKKPGASSIRKPGKPTDPKLIAQTDDHKAKESLKKDQVHDHDLDAVESKEKLSHPTVNRARVPSKRPPSIYSNKDNQESEKEHGNSASEPKQVSPEHETKMSPGRQTRPPPPNPQDVAAAKGADAGAIAELKKELQQLRQSTVARQQYDQLQHELHSLRDSVEQMKGQYNKRFIELMNEIDEEKKIKLSMQVEVDRLKKLVTQM